MTDGLAPMEVPSGINCPSRRRPPDETSRGRTTGIGGERRADSQTQDVKYGMFWICAKLAMGASRSPCDVKALISCMTLAYTLVSLMMFSIVAQMRAEVVSGPATIKRRVSALRSSSVISSGCVDW